jgi:hypothetical protein
VWAFPIPRLLQPLAAEEEPVMEEGVRRKEVAAAETAAAETARMAIEVRRSSQRTAYQRIWIWMLFY